MKNSRPKTPREKEIVKVTLAGSFVNLGLVALKFMAGFAGRSGAMIADAVHSLSDFATDIVILVCIRISSKPHDEDHRYGHGKFETLATAIIGVVLFFVGLDLLVGGGAKVYGVLFRGEELQSPGRIAFAAALVSVVAKEVMYRYTIAAGRKHNSKTVIANAWHHRSDAFSSIGTAAGIGGAIFLGGDWAVLDPIAAMVVSIFIIRVAVQLVMPALNELMEKALPPEEEQKILAVIYETPGVEQPHNIRTRRIGNGCAIEMHLCVDGSTRVYEAHEITKSIEERLRGIFGQETFINLHVEPIIPGDPGRRP